MRMLRQYSLYFAWIVSLAATGGSLYFSEVMNYIPCELCWYQRIFMYPLVFLLGMACYKDDRNIIPYVLPLTIIGGLISAHHYAEQKIPGYADLVPCSSLVPCDIDYLDWFGGVVTIPLLALIAFVMVTALLLVRRRG